MGRLLGWFRRVSAPRDAEFERRLHACEAHLTSLEDRLNERGVFSGG